MALTRILLADDHAMVRKGVRSLLESAPDLEVVGEATDGEEAVRLSEELTPDVVIMDIAMPVSMGSRRPNESREQGPAVM